MTRVRGKGGHGTIRFADRLTVVQSGQAEHMWTVWLTQLGLPKDAF